MDIATILGLVGGAVCIVMSVLTSGGTMGGIFDVPSLIFVLGGSFFALFIAYPMSSVLGIFSIMGRAFKIPDFNEKTLVQDMVTLSEKARREGILALEEGLEDLSDDFMKNGLRLVVDGTDGVIIRGIMQSEMNQIEGRHLDWINIIVAWAGLAPGYVVITIAYGVLMLGKRSGVILIKEITPKHIAELSNAMAENKITSKQGKEVFAEMMETAKLPSKIIEEKGMVVVSDTGAIETYVKEVIAENPKAIADYKNGKTNVVGWLMGQVMKKSGGKASPKTATELLKAELEKA